MAFQERFVTRRLLSLADCESLSGLAQKLALHHGETLRPDPLTLWADRDWFSASIASTDGKDVGFVGWHRKYACQTATRLFELQNLYVEPDYRGRRVAVSLVFDVVRAAFDEGASIGIGVRKSNTAALEFYKKLGCTVVDRNDLWRCRWTQEQMRAFAAWAQTQFEEKT